MRSRTMTRLTAATLGAAALAGFALLAPISTPAPAAADEQGASCEVTEAVLEWGVKESFRSYITSSIAKGGWEVGDGAEYETPSFRWANGAGSLDPSTGEGSVSFTGSIVFTGHEGVLNLAFANPTVEFRGDGSANLLLDARSNNAQGELAVDGTQISVGRIDGIGEIDAESGSASVVAAPVILTADGAEAFAGFYATGDALDPVTLTLTLAPCEAPAGESGDAGDDAGSGSDSDEVVAEPISAPAESEVPWLPIIIGGAAVVVIAVTAGLLVAGRKKGAAGAADAAE